MTDTSAADNGGASAEQIAYLLLRNVAHVERKQIEKNGVGEMADRKYVLDAYAECLMAVRRPNSRSSA